MIAPDHNGRGDFTRGHHLIESQAGLHALAIPEPADASRQALKLDVASRHLEPADEVAVVGKELGNRAVRRVDIFRIARERDPTEWPFAFTEQRTNISRNEAGILKRIFH